MIERTADVLIEEIAAAVMMADAADQPSLSALLSLFEELDQRLPAESTNPAIKEGIRTCCAVLSDLVADRVKDGTDFLSFLSDTISALQVLLRGGAATLPRSPLANGDASCLAETAATPSSDPFAPGPTPDGKEIELPPWVEEATFREFLLAIRPGPNPRLHFLRQLFSRPLR